MLFVKLKVFNPSRLAGRKILDPPSLLHPPGLHLPGFHLPSSSPCHQEVVGRGYLHSRFLFQRLSQKAGLSKDNPTSLQNMLKIIQFIWFGGSWVNDNTHRWMRPLIPLWYWIFCVFEQATEKWNKIKYEYDQSGALSHTIRTCQVINTGGAIEIEWFG